MMIVPANYPQRIIKESAFDAEYDFTNSDGSAYDFSSWVVTASLLSASTANDVDFSVDVEGGAVTLSLTDEQTSALRETVSTRYAIKMSKSDDSIGPYFLVEGDVQIVSIA